MKPLALLGSIALGSTTALALAGAIATGRTPAIAATPVPQVTPLIPGLNRAIALSASGLAQHLRRSGAKMYGAYWCGHCQDQKALFGRAFSQIPYIECDAKGPNGQPSLCQRAGIQGYPTWEIRGRKYPGVQSLEALARLSNYRGQ